MQVLLKERFSVNSDCIRGCYLLCADIEALGCSRDDVNSNPMPVNGKKRQQRIEKNALMRRLSVT